MGPFCMSRGRYSRAHILFADYQTDAREQERSCSCDLWVHWWPPHIQSLLGLRATFRVQFLLVFCARSGRHVRAGVLPLRARYVTPTRSFAMPPSRTFNLSIDVHRTPSWRAAADIQASQGREWLRPHTLCGIFRPERDWTLCESVPKDESR
jgi:hypothetical protein